MTSSDPSVISVVLIDDHLMLLESVEKILREDPLIDIVGVALTASKGIDLVKEQRPDIVVIDYRLPDMNAPQAIKILREVAPELKIVTFSGSEYPGALFASMRAGSSAWVRKTRAIQELRDVIHDVARGLPVTNSEIDALPRLSDLVLHYQPIYDLSTLKIVGFEALVRWQHPERGLLSPDHFLPMAVETGYIVEIDRWVWKQAARQLNRWQHSFAGSPRVWMSINLAASDLAEPDIFDSITTILSDAEIDPNDLVVEVTESVLLDDTAQTMDFLNHLKELGIGLALDDFGTAFSSLSYVRRFPFDHLKLDISFTAELPESKRSMVLVEEICHLATSMGMMSIAEGIERPEQAEALRQIGCKNGQGYFFSRPVSVAECNTLLETGLH